MKKRGEPCAYLDVTHLGAGKLEERFPHIVATCRQYGIDPATQWIPVVPAAHYSCGGVARLSSLDRDLLKDTLGVVKRFKALLRQRFHLDAM